MRAGSGSVADGIEGGGVAIADERLDRRERAEPGDDVAAPVDAVLGEVRVAQGGEQRRTLGVRGEVEGPPTSTCACPPEVVATALAGDGGVTEQAEHVVAHLEGQPHGVAVGRQGVGGAAPSSSAEGGAPAASGRVTV